MIEKIYASILILGVALFAQEALREAVDNGDYATVRQMVKKNEIEEIYCGKMPPDSALQVYGKLFNSMPEASFASCPLQFSISYGTKVCADKKQLSVCMDAIHYLQMETLQGSLSAVRFFDEVVEVALKNKSYQQPIKNLVDTILWVKCPKKDIESCIAGCEAYADSTGDTLQLEKCREVPEKGVAKKVTVTSPSPLNNNIQKWALEGFWGSPASLASAWLKTLLHLQKKNVIPDLLVPNKDFITRWVQAHHEQGNPLPGKELFRFCEAWDGAVDSILIALESKVRCPVFVEVKDARDNQTYKATDIGGSFWIVQNMNYKTENESTCYDEEEEYCSVYGRLYTWDAAQLACPEGYRLSTDADWKRLEKMAGGAAEKLRSNGSDDYAFSVLFGGYANKNGISTLLTEGAYFWTEVQKNGRAMARSLFTKEENVERFSSDTKIYMSVRCVKNN
ncbi:MAG TPA: hypothetical protein GX724_03080 [Fibrobacter sp.]|nr:hypothetical protein [Fibrobacter sp.]